MIALVRAAVNGREQGAPRTIRFQAGGSAVTFVMFWAGNVKAPHVVHPSPLRLAAGALEITRVPMRELSRSGASRRAMGDGGSAVATC